MVAVLAKWVLVVAVIVIALTILWWNTQGGFHLPRGGEPTSTQVRVATSGDVVPPGSATEGELREVMVTDGVKHSIPLSAIVQGCPGRDCIPSIDAPQYESPDAAGAWVRDDDLGISLTVGGVTRFYPYRMLVRHEIVNDTVKGKRVLVTYCPLCFTGIVFDPVVGGEGVEFGVSGKLWNSNLIMYDRKTDSLWSQITGEAVVGAMTGARLRVIPSDITKFGLWKRQYPDGEVLARASGRYRDYADVPYGGDLTDIPPFFPLSNEDHRLPETAYVLGLVLDGQAKAYHVDAVKRAGNFQDTFAGRTLDIGYDAQADAVRIFEVRPDGTRKRLAPIPSFWFSWAAVYPGTELYQ